MHVLLVQYSVLTYLHMCVCIDYRGIRLIGVLDVRTPVHEQSNNAYKAYYLWGGGRGEYLGIKIMWERTRKKTRHVTSNIICAHHIEFDETHEKPWLRNTIGLSTPIYGCIVGMIRDTDSEYDDMYGTTPYAATGYPKHVHMSTQSTCRRNTFRPGSSTTCCRLRSDIPNSRPTNLQHLDVHL